MYWILMLAMLGGCLLLIPHGSRSQMLYLIIKLAILDYLFSFDVFFLGLAQFTDIYTCFFVS